VSVVVVVVINSNNNDKNHGRCHCSKRHLTRMEEMRIMEDAIVRRGT
jgi:hypothetical protein